MPEDYFEHRKEHYNSEVSEYDEVYFGDFEGHHSLLTARDIVLDRLSDLDDCRVLDIGCGNAGITIPLLQRGFDVYGFDLAEEMIESGRRHLSERDFDPQRIQTADFTEQVPFSGEFDVVISIGLFSHFDDVTDQIERLSTLVTDDGIVLIQFRNVLLSLYSYNEHTYKFIFSRLLDDIDIPDELEGEFEKRIRDICNLDTKVDREQATDAEGGFDNPLTIPRAFESTGFDVDDIWFYNYHPLPPEFEELAPDAYRNLSYQMEDKSDWRGYISASSFIVEATQ